MTIVNNYSAGGRHFVHCLHYYLVSEIDSKNTVLFQRFYMCHENGRSGRFTCPVGTLFSERLGVCDWARRVTCPAPGHSLGHTP